MNAEEFSEMSVDDARSKVSKIGLKGLTKKNSGEFYYDFFRWGLWRPDFKDKLSILVENGLDLNQPICERCDEKRTPIFQALSDPDGKTAAAIKALAEYGANINLPDANGRTPIMAASFYRHALSKSSIVKALIKLGADLNCKDNKGKLVTELADANSLPLLIKAGAPINVKNQATLLAALRSGNLEITIGLLEKGAKAELDLNECLNTAFLSTISHAEPKLFKKGLSLKQDDGSWSRYHHTFRKAAADFLKLLEACDVAPTANEVEACDEDTLPPTLRVDAWPPQRPEPTGPINVQAPPAPAADFHFPPDLQSACVQMCEIKSDKRSADKKRSDFSKFISTVEKTLTDIENTDWETETRKFIKNPISRVYKESTSSRIWKANELLRHHQEVGFNTYYTEQVHRELGRGKGRLRINIGMGFMNTFNHFVEIKTSIATLGHADLRVWSNDEELLRDKKFISYAEILENGVIFTRNVEKEINFDDIGIFESGDIQKYLDIFKFVKFNWLWTGAEKLHYCTLAYRIGPSAAEALQSIAKTGDEHALGCLSPGSGSSLKPPSPGY